MCESYTEVERHNFALCTRSVIRSGDDHVPLPSSIIPSVLVQAAIENTFSGVGGSHDTCMVLFQKTSDICKNYTPQLKGNFDFDWKQRALYLVKNCIHVHLINEGLFQIIIPRTGTRTSSQNTF